VAKSILCQFEVQKTRKAGNGDSEDLDNTAKLEALTALAQELELDDGSTELADEEDDEDDEVTDDNDDGLDDERNGMSKEEVAELEKSLVPIWLMLTKVSLQTQPEII
jgi:hypothetical protein